MIAQNRRLSIILITASILLLTPFVAMQFTNEVNWGVFDFIVAGVLLFGTGLACELVLRKVKTFKYRIGIIAVVLFALLLVWAELAVGVFGSPVAGS